ncbi:thiamine pyrophosphate-binding protein [Pseudomonas sp. SMV71]|uniref:thiamine pyrophosphate-binding protein n=1 Tax=Pseudomonas sp. SMV71 TaxID=3390195 RepID=UPI003F8670FF
MTTPIHPIDLHSPAERARHLLGVLRDAGTTSLTGTPCGILAPLWRQARDKNSDLSLVTVSREDTALAFAAGEALAGGHPAVLMQNSGFGNCVNVMASLICPYDLHVTLVISLRGTGNDTTPENSAMGATTASILSHWGVATTLLAAPEDLLIPRNLARNGPSAVLIAPEYFGWCP